MFGCKSIQLGPTTQSDPQRSSPSAQPEGSIDLSLILALCLLAYCVFRWIRGKS